MDSLTIQIKLLPNHFVEVKLYDAVITAKNLFLADPKKSSPSFEEWQVCSGLQ